MRKGRQKRMGINIAIRNPPPFGTESTPWIVKKDDPHTHHFQRSIKRLILDGVPMIILLQCVDCALGLYSQHYFDILLNPRCLASQCQGCSNILFRDPMEIIEQFIIILFLKLLSCFFLLLLPKLTWLLLTFIIFFFMISTYFSSSYQIISLW